MNDITTTNLADFGYRERVMAEKLLKAWREQGLPPDFYDNEVTIMMNTHSGNVFLTNSEFQVAMINGGKLESFYSCPQCGHEGFLDEMPHNASGPERNSQCREYLTDIGVLTRRQRKKAVKIG